MLSCMAAKLAGNPDLIVAKKREKDVITTQAGIEALMKLALDQMQPKGQGQEVDVQTALKQVAASWGLPVADIEKAIRDYQTHDVYQQGLKKLLENKYREAEPLLEEAVQNKLVDLVEAQRNLGLSRPESIPTGQIRKSIGRLPTGLSPSTRGSRASQQYALCDAQGSRISKPGALGAQGRNRG